VRHQRLLLGLAEAPAAEVDALVEAAVTQVGRLMPASDAGAGVAPAISVEASAGEAPAPVAARITAEAPASPRRAATVGPAIRVSLDRLDSLMNLVGELVIARSRLDRRLSELDRAGELLLFSQERMAKAVKDFEVKREAGGWAPRPATGGDGPGLLPADPVAGGRLDAESRAPLTQLFDELEFDRYDDFDILARSVAELSADLTEVQTQVGGLIRTIWEDTAQIQRLTGNLKTEITRARMVPVARLFARFGRQVREAARAAGKTVALEVRGETVEMDSSIAEAIADPLLHLVQNAITHGIEPEDERQARGKPSPGTIRLRAAHRGGFVYIEVEDDGRGIDVELVKAAAVRQGFLSSEAVAGLSHHEALNLIFLPGFSTAPVVTTASGRGVGMDVVRTNVSRLGGEIDVETKPGAGTRFTLRLPLTVLISDALMIRTGSEALAIPVSAVRMILTVRPGAIQSGGGSERVRVDGQMVDLFRLDRLLGLAPGTARERIPVVVLRSGGTSLAVAVDELGGKEEVVIKSLGTFLDGSTPFTGATISGEGRVILLIDPARLVALAEGLSRAPVAEAHPRAAEPERGRPAPAAEAARRVLLVDDSISVRRFVGHMLERAGFHVITANDGAEALRHLTDTPVHAVITDLEMPRVNGYELIEDLRRRPATRDLPVVVLTTRAGEKHLNLARRLGIEHYVSKPVDEHAFVQLIASLTAPDRVEGELAGVAR
jgi:chemosensory pili system protein ChpA (sensor histidine kinase/response regulator)